MNQDFRDLLEALLAVRARFLIVGAHAMAFYGVVRATGDLDLWIDGGRVNSRKVWTALTSFGAPLEALGFSVDDLRQEEAVWQIGIPPRRIDILTTIDGVSFDAAWKDRQSVEWDGIVVPVLGLKSLRENKEATGRDKDRLDLELLEQVVDPGEAR